MAVAALAATARPAGAADVPESWFGTWKLNIARSTYDPGPPPYKRATYRIEPHGDGLKVIYDMVHPRGGVTHLEWIGRLDGRPYPVQGIDQFVTYAYTALDDGSFEVVVTIDDRVAAKTRVTLSPDGRTMTTTIVGTGARGQKVTTATVYEKQ